MISLDVFDTAIFRTVYFPQDIFWEMERCGVVASGFAEKRISAERSASIKNPHYTIKDIYTFLPGEDFGTEIVFEESNIYANPEILTMYLENPNNFIFISDMYLPSYVIMTFLSKCGYANPRVYVSCEHCATKVTGELFRKVEAIVGKIDRHYDDNYHCIEGATRANISGKYIRNNNLPVNIEVESKLKKYLAENTKGGDAFRYGYLFAPLILETTRWVMSFGKRVHFLMREGYVPSLLAPHFGDNFDLIYASRISLVFACIDTSVPISHEKNDICRTVLLRTGINIDDEKLLYERADRERDEVYRYFSDKNFSDGDIVFDPCAGSGAHLLVAKENNRRYLGCELNTEWYEVALERLNKKEQ